MKSLVLFAADRGVRLLPSIELQSGAAAILAAYPELRLNAALPARVQRAFGVFREARLVDVESSVEVRRTVAPAPYKFVHSLFVGAGRLRVVFANRLR